MRNRSHDLANVLGVNQARPRLSAKVCVTVFPSIVRHGEGRRGWQAGNRQIRRHADGGGIPTRIDTLRMRIVIGVTEGSRKERLGTKRVVVAERSRPIEARTGS